MLVSLQSVLAALLISTTFVAGQASAQPSAGPNLQLIESTRAWEFFYDSSDDGACFATASYKSGTRFFIGKFGTTGDWSIMMTNDKWASIKPDQTYDMKYVFDGRRTWTGEDVGIENGLKSVGLRDDFIEDYARSSRLEVFFGDTKIDDFSLKGTRAATNAVKQCFDTRMKKVDPFATAENDDPFAGAGIDDVQNDGRDLIPYGTRVGMDVTVISRQNLGSDSARIVIEHTRQNAINFCRDYVGKVTEECIQEEMALPIADHIEANCKNGEFQDAFGQKLRFDGLNSNQSDVGDPRHLLWSFENDEYLGNYSASGYFERLIAYDELCPNSVDKIE
ncbi:hypothetical protein [Oricola indica]|uniref:hypothetical protein n=1 Tax=Oricola indica TaxID=2872591 RepID=UPI003CCBB7DE